MRKLDTCFDQSGKSFLGMLCFLVVTVLEVEHSAGLSLSMRSLRLATPYGFLMLMAMANMMTGLWRISTVFIHSFRHQRVDRTDAVKGFARKICDKILTELQKVFHW